jgi:hypothetical protein
MAKAKRRNAEYVAYYEMRAMSTADKEGFANWSSLFAFGLKVRRDKNFLHPDNGGPESVLKDKFCYNKACPNICSKRL